MTSNGVTSFWYYSTDLSGNSEAAKRLTVRIDTTHPVTRALANATVARYRSVTLRLRVNDSVSPRATATVKVFSRGVLKKTLPLGLRSTNAEIRYTYTCWLPRGSYTWKVYATDLAGNRQSVVGHAALTVR